MRVDIYFKAGDQPVGRFHHKGGETTAEDYAEQVSGLREGYRALGYTVIEPQPGVIFAFLPNDPMTFLVVIKH